MKYKRMAYQFQAELIKNKKTVNKYVQRIFIDAQSAFLNEVQANKDRLPYVTGNLHDSIGTVVSVNGRVIRAQFLPTEAKTTSELTGKERLMASSYHGVQVRGSVEAVRLVRRAAYPRGLGATLIVGVPYAEILNERGRHLGYLDRLEFDFIKAMNTGLIKYDYYNVFDRKRPIL